MMTKITPRRTVKFISRITTKLPKAIVRLRTVMQAGRSADEVAPAAAVDSSIKSNCDSVQTSDSGSDSQDVEHQRKGSARDHDVNDSGHHRRGRGITDRRGVVAALKAAQASRNRDDHTVDGALEDAAKHVVQSNHVQRLPEISRER